METTQADAVAAGVLAGGIVTAILIGTIVIWLLYIIAYWKLFKKAGEPGWKSIIPVYNTYIIYKISWCGLAFWLMLILTLASVAIMAAGGTDLAYFYSYTSTDVDITSAQASALMGNPITFTIGMICSLVVSIIQIVDLYKLSKAFGHGVGYFLGLLFLNWIFVLILGYGSSRYVRRAPGVYENE